MTPQALYRWMVDLIGSLPDTRVTMTWGEPHFRVGDKIFSGWGAHQDGRYAMSAKLDKDKQAALVASDPRFSIAPYVGKHGWVSFCPGDQPELGEIEALLLESYRNVAPKKLVAQLDGQPARRGGQTTAKAAGKAATAAQATRAVRTRPAAAKTATAKPRPAAAKTGEASTAQRKTAAASRRAAVKSSSAKTGPKRTSRERATRQGR